MFAGEVAFQQISDSAFTFKNSAMKPKVLGLNLSAKI